MSLIKELKTKNENSVNIVDFFELILPDVKTKYYEMIIKVFNNTSENKYKDKVNEARRALITLFPEKEKEITDYSSFNIIIYSYLFDLLHDTNINIESIKKFIDYNERNLIDKNDITQYKSYDDIHNQMICAEMKTQSKELEKQVVKLFEDEEWLMLKPLTYEASIKYGYNTKWCTASESNTTYFDSYSKEGILIYFINKVDNVKIAVYKKMFTDKGLRSITPEITFWNQVDKQTDSFDTGLPGYLFDKLRDHFEKHIVTNHKVLELIQKQNGETTNSDDIKKILDGLKPKNGLDYGMGAVRGVGSSVSTYSSEVQDDRDILGRRTPTPIEQEFMRGEQEYMRGENVSEGISGSMSHSSPSVGLTNLTGRIR